jgi:LPS-assembly protein
MMYHDFFNNFLFFICAFLLCNSVHAQEITAITEQPIAATVQPAIPIQFSADDLIYEKQQELVIAKGNVEVIHEGRTVTADEIRYNLTDDKVEALGNVTLIEANGDRFQSSYIVLRNNMKDGLILKLKGEMADDSRFWAEQGERKGNTTRFKNARYTPCKPCIESLKKNAKEQREKDPVWQIKADEVKWDQDEQTISYKNATFEVGGVPVFYTPYFSYPDGTVDQKSGILRPTAGFRSELGAFWDQRYYNALSPSQDLTIGAIATTKEGITGVGEYRKNFGVGDFTVEGSATKSSRTDNIAGVNKNLDNEFRGHVFAKTRWDIDEKWRSGADLNLTTDDQYLRQYGFDENGVDDDVLTSQLYAERFDDRDYARARMLGFQDVRVTQFANDDQPFVFPSVEASFYGDPNATLGGRWGAQGSALNFVRESGGQDVTRLVGEAEWERRFITPIGLVTTATTSLRGDSFFTRDIDPATLAPGEDDSDMATRFFPQAHFVSQYPLAKPYEGGEFMIEPIASLTLAPNLDNNDAIPNEDSGDTQLDATNIFQANRFTGLDRIEDRSRVTYGVKTGFYNDDASYGDIFLGQSYRFEARDNPFSAGSGLEEQNSDYVGAIRGQYKDMFNFNYRFQFNGDTLAAERHEIYADYTGDRFGLNTGYFSLDEVLSTGFIGPREQLSVGGYINFTDDFSMNSQSIYNLGTDKDGLLKSNVGLRYTHECYTFALNAERNYTDASSGEAGTSVTFRVGLKNLSGFNE